MRNLRERLCLAKVVLKELSRQPLCRTELEKRTVRKIGTHATFESIFHLYARNTHSKNRCKLWFLLIQA